MKSVGIEHAEAREWKTLVDQNGDLAGEYIGPSGDWKEITVREVRPGEITLTREELREIMANHECYDMDALIEQMLFGPESLPEGTEVGE